jgi:hypothetical protein
MPDVPKEDCVVPSEPVPAEALAKYAVDRDLHSENDIARYVELEAEDEVVKHVEKVKTEVVLGDSYDAWDVTTDKGGWWVISNLTNLYSKRHFVSLDYTLSFHVGLMMRMRSRSTGASSDEPTPFEEVLRREQQAQERHERTIEAEDYQAVGMLLRECLLALITALRRRARFEPEAAPPQDANFIEWANLLMDALCAGPHNQSLRQHVKHLARDTWQLVNWLTHARNADKTASSIAIHSCSTVVGHFVQILEGQQTSAMEQCPLCKSRNIRTHFDPEIGEDGDYYLSCGVCEWDNHPVDDEKFPTSNQT